MHVYDIAMDNLIRFCDTGMLEVLSTEKEIKAHPLRGQFVFTKDQLAKHSVDGTFLVWICSLFTFKVGFLKISTNLTFFTLKLLLNT